MSSSVREYLLEHMTVPDYVLPRTVVDNWLIGSNKTTGLKEIKLQNQKDHPRMKIYDYRSAMSTICDKYLRLQHELYTNQTIFAMVFAYLLQRLHIINSKLFTLIQANTPLTASLHEHGKIVLRKDFRVLKLPSLEGVLTVRASILVNDRYCHFTFELIAS